MTGNASSKALRMLVMLQLLVAATFSSVLATAAGSDVAGCIDSCWTEVGLAAQCDVSAEARTGGVTEACICPDPLVYALFTTCIEDTCPFDGNRSVFPTEMACEGHEATLEADKELTANGAVASYPVALSMFAKGRMAAVPPGGWNLCHRFMGCPNAPRAVPEASELVARGFPGGWNLCHRFMGCPPKARRATADAVNSVSHIYPGAWGPCGFFHVCENAVSHDDGNYSGNDKRSPAVPPSFGFCGAPGASCAGAGTGAGTDAMSKGAAMSPDTTNSIVPADDLTKRDAKLRLGFCGAPGASCAGGGNVDANAAFKGAPAKTTLATVTYVVAAKRDPNPQIAQLLSAIGRTSKKSRPTITPAELEPTEKHGSNLPDSFGFCGAKGSSCGFDADAARNMTTGNGTAVYQK